MKARLPKSFLNIPQKEKDIINKVLADELKNAIDREEAMLQKIWIKFACIVLNKTFGFGKIRLQRFIANWENMYRLNSKFHNEEEREEYIRSEIERIFPNNSYPSKHIDKCEDL